MSFRKEVFKVAGGFRDGMGRVGAVPAGCEETELCIRVRQRLPGSTLLYQPAAVVGHHVPASRARWAYFRSRCYAEGVSKGLVTRFVGARDGLSSERAYVLRTLPHGVLRGLADRVSKGDLDGPRRAGAILAGLAITTAGYLAASLSTRLADWKLLSPEWPPAELTGRETGKVE
jgi:hypothetical protein